MDLGSSEDAVLSQSEVVSSSNSSELTEPQILSLQMEMDSVSSQTHSMKSIEDKGSVEPPMLVDESVSSSENEFMSDVKEGENDSNGKPEPPI